MLMTQAGTWMPNFLDIISSLWDNLTGSAILPATVYIVGGVCITILIALGVKRVLF